MGQCLGDDARGATPALAAMTSTARWLPAAFLMVAAGLIGRANAEVPPPNYRDVIAGAAQAEVARRAEADGMAAAEVFARNWSRQVAEDARVVYAVGLAWRLAGDDGKARSSLDRALKMDPLLVAARYDRGEVLLNVGDLPAAEVDFREVARLAPEHWAGHFRLADLAGRRRDAAGFETHLVAALRCGFSMRSVVADPRWRGYLADAVLGPVLRKLVEVYQDESILRALEGTQENQP